MSLPACENRDKSGPDAARRRRLQDIRHSCTSVHRGSRFPIAFVDIAKKEIVSLGWVVGGGGKDEDALLCSGQRVWRRTEYTNMHGEIFLLGYNMLCFFWHKIKFFFCSSILSVYFSLNVFIFK